MKNAHTPGPWHDDCDGGGWYICREDGEFLGFINPPDFWEEPHYTNAEADANARLMAAAPELLEALKALVERGTDSPEHIAAERAIAKATGEAA